MQICKNCKSREVARCRWVNPNDNTIYHDVDSGTFLEWCMECRDETTIINGKTDIFETLTKIFVPPSHTDLVHQAIRQGHSNLPPSVSENNV